MHDGARKKPWLWSRTPPTMRFFCANKVVVMDQGTVLREGTPAQCIMSEILAHIYGTQACVVDVDVEDGKHERVCIPLR